MKIEQKNRFHIQSLRLKPAFISALVFITLTIAVGCKKFVTVDPPITSLTGSSAFTSNASAASVMTSIYDNMVAPGAGVLSGGGSSISLLNGLSADELVNFNPSQSPYPQFYTNSLNSNNSEPGWWVELYNEIHVANAVIEGLSVSTKVTPAIKTQLLGEAKFMRAFLHFYATNLYGDVPLVTSTNYLVNNVIKRSPKAQVYQQIMQDLQEAQSDLSNNFVDGSGNVTTGRIRPNKAAATALQARVYLYYGNLTGDTKYYSKADSAATIVINNNQYSLLNDLNQVFLKNSNEAIWQLQAIIPGVNTYDAEIFVLTSPPGSGQTNVALSPFLLGAFETGDQRRANWVGSYTADAITYYYFPNKYKVWVQDPTQPPVEYTMILRLAEQYLIRAEARAQQGNVSGAQADLNAIRIRAGLQNTTANDKTSLLTAILHERQAELFTEWGHRWFDLIRTGNINSVMGSPGNECAQKGGTWKPDWTLLPIPRSEIQINPNLTQNASY